MLVAIGMESKNSHKIHHHLEQAPMISRYLFYFCHLLFSLKFTAYIYYSKSIASLTLGKLLDGNQTSSREENNHFISN